MSYTDDAALAKLSALNDTQDSIATAAQWFLFHRKHAERTVQLWHQRLRDSPSSKRLTLIYLANEVAQQSKVRKKDDFVLALAPVIADATSIAFRGASAEVQHRVLRVVEVWKQRGVFEDRVLVELEARIKEVDKSRGNNTALASRGNQAAPTLPPEILPIVDALTGVAKTIVPTRSSLTESRENYDRVVASSAPAPSPPVHAARLNGLLKTLAAAEGSLSESVKTRQNLVESLEKLLASTRRDLETDLDDLREVTVRRAEIDAKKNEVEMDIMRGLATEDPRAPDNAHGVGLLQPPESHRPEVEALTPPPGSNNGPFEPPVSELVVKSAAATVSEPVAAPVAEPVAEAPIHHQAPGIELLSSIASQYQSVPVHTNGSNKRRRVEGGEEFPDLGADDDIDADVAEILRKESQS